MTGRLVNVRPKPGFLMDGAGDIVPARANVVRIGDKLTNVMSGKGTTNDRSVYNQYNFMPVEPSQAEAAYRTSWLMRKIVDVPPLDMTRAWRQWQAEDTDIEAIELGERKFQLREKCKRALVLSRLWGGGAIVIGIKGADPAEPLMPETLGKDSLAWMHVFGRHQLTAGQLITDPESEWFAQPEDYTLTTQAGTTLRIHPSRVVAFVGQKSPEGSLLGGEWFWGDPLYQSIKVALENADLAQDGFAALIDGAALDIIKIPNMMAQVGSQEYETRLMTRLRAAAMGKSTWRALMIDGDEEWDQRQVTWTGMPDMIASYLQIVAGAADIPVTRLLGQSPKGLQSTGDGEERDYHAMIAARQDELLAPALDRIDEVLIRSALGDKPSDIWYTFNSLERVSPKDAADIESKYAAAIKSYSDMAVFSDQALADIAKNRMTESGQWPGSEKAFEDAEAAGIDPAGTEADLMTAEELAAQAKGGDPTSAGAGGSVVPPRRAANDTWFATDATPKPLYVHRKLINAAEVIAWAKSQGFATTLPADDMHVTVLYSRQAVDPMKLGETWTSEDDGGLTVKPGGPRAVEKLGEDAVVLLFASWSLSSRHRDMVEAGGSHDYPEYQPHVTLSYSAEGVDMNAVKPYTGELRFGPELFEPIDLDWKAKVAEE